VKAAGSGVRGVFWRAVPNGSQQRRLPGGGHERGDWYIRYSCAVGHRPPHWEKVGPKTLATRIVERRRTQVRQDGFCPRQALARKLTMGEALALVVADYEANGRSALAEVTRHEKRLGAYFGSSRDVATLTSGDIDSYADSRRKEGAAVATVNRELACLRRGLRLAYRKGRLPTVPYVAIGVERNVRTGFFEEHELGLS